MRLSVGLIGACFASACDYSGMGGSCVVGPCQPRYTIPEFEYVAVGAPRLDHQGSTASMRVGDSISVYFVRRRWLAPCDQPGDTLSGGIWTIGGPLGQVGDFSGIASVTVRSNTRAVVLAKSAGHFGIRYAPAALPDVPSYSVWYDVRFCPENTGVLDIHVIP